MPGEGDVCARTMISRNLTFDISGLPKAGPLDGMVRLHADVLVLRHWFENVASLLADQCAPTVQWRKSSRLRRSPLTEAELVEFPATGGKLAQLLLSGPGGRQAAQAQV